MATTHIAIRTYTTSVPGSTRDHQPASMTFEEKFEIGAEPGEYAGSLQKAITQAAERAVATLQPMVQHPGSAS